MRFRPCIDIHNGSVKQIVGSSLRDGTDSAKENYVAEKDAAWFSLLYKEMGLSGGHVILLNKAGTPQYEATKTQAIAALSAYPGGMQAGGGINAENGEVFLDAGASHLIATSFLFPEGRFSEKCLEQLVRAYGKEKLVIDLSCRKDADKGGYYVVTDRWQTFTGFEVNAESLDVLALSCSEFLIHGVDVEGKGTGMEEELVRLLADWKRNSDSAIPLTYAGGIASMEDIQKFAHISGRALDFTIGSALDIFGGTIPISKAARAK